MSLDLKDDFKKMEEAQAKRLEKMKAQLGMNSHSIDVQAAAEKQNALLSTSGGRKVQFSENGAKQTSSLFAPNDLQLTMSSSVVAKANEAGRKSTTKLDNSRKENDERLARLEKENERLQNALADKQSEIKRLEKRVEEDSIALAGDTSMLQADTAALRIVELSKRIRELNCDLEAEKSRSKKAALRVRELEKQLADKSGNSSASAKAESESECAAKLRELETKFRTTEKRLAEVKLENAKQTKDLQLATHVLRRELGEHFQLNAAKLNDEQSWRGRAQQIALLTDRVRELEAQNASLRNSIAARRMDEQRATLDELIQELANPTDNEASAAFVAAGNSVMSGATNLGLDADADERTCTQLQKVPSAMISETKQKDLLRRIDRDRKDQIEKLESELKTVREENSTLKERISTQKARHSSLKQETSVQKEQIETLLAKARHDDELIATLMQQYAAAKGNIDRLESESARLRSDLGAARDERRSADHEASQLEAALRGICEEKQVEIDRLKQALEASKAAFRRADRENDAAGDSGGESRIPVPINRLSAKLARLDSAPSAPPLHHSASSARGSSAATISAAAAVNVNVEELTALMRTSEIERKRLTEFVRVLESRNSDAQSKLLAAQKAVSSLQVRQVALEKQLERQRVVMREVPKGAAAGSGGKATLLRSNLSDSSAQQDNSDAEAQFERLSEQLAVEKEDNTALQRRIDEMCREKEEDFALLSQIVEETKRVFLEAIRKLNDEKTAQRS